MDNVQYYADLTRLRKAMNALTIFFSSKNVVGTIPLQKHGLGR